MTARVQGHCKPLYGRKDDDLAVDVCRNAAIRRRCPEKIPGAFFVCALSHPRSFNNRLRSLGPCNELPFFTFFFARRGGSATDTTTSVPSATATADPPASSRWGGRRGDGRPGGQAFSALASRENATLAGAALGSPSAPSVHPSTRLRYSRLIGGSVGRSGPLKEIAAEAPRAAHTLPASRDQPRSGTVPLPTGSGSSTFCMGFALDRGPHQRKPAGYGSGASNPGVGEGFVCPPPIPRQKKPR